MEQRGNQTSENLVESEDPNLRAEIMQLKHRLAGTDQELQKTNLTLRYIKKKTIPKIHNLHKNHILNFAIITKMSQIESKKSRSVKLKKNGSNWVKSKNQESN